MMIIGLARSNHSVSNRFFVIKFLTLYEVGHHILIDSNIKRY